MSHPFFGDYTMARSKTSDLCGKIFIFTAHRTRKMCCVLFFHKASITNKYMFFQQSSSSPDTVRSRRSLNVDDEVAKYRKKAGWYDDDARMKAFNNEAFSSSSQSLVKNRDFWMGLISTLLAFIAAVLVMFGFFYYVKYFLSSNDEKRDPVVVGDDEFPHRRRSSRSRSRRRRGSRSRSHHRRTARQEPFEYADATVPISTLYPEEGVDRHPVTEYTILDNKSDMKGEMMNAPVQSPLSIENQTINTPERASGQSSPQDKMQLKSLHEQNYFIT
jgi:hypothetical protein